MSAGIGLPLSIVTTDKNKPMSHRVAEGTFWWAVGEVASGAMFVPMVANMAKAGTQFYLDDKRYGQHNAQQAYRSNFGGDFQDTQQGYTMRQRAIMAMQQSRTNARSVLGSEARAMHR